MDNVCARQSYAELAKPDILPKRWQPDPLGPSERCAGHNLLVKTPVRHLSKIRCFTVVFSLRDFRCKKSQDLAGNTRRK